MTKPKRNHPRLGSVSLSPLEVVLASLVIIGSLVLRRQCIVPGGFLHRRAKGRRNAKSSLLLSSTLLVFTMAILIFLVALFCSYSYSAAFAAGIVILFVHALDHLVPRSDSSQQDTQSFKRHLRQSWAPPKQSYPESDSSESYDMERHGGP